VGLPLQVLSNNLCRMTRGCLFLSMIVPAVIFACKDDTIQDVPEDICASGIHWIGGKRGDPRMYPGRDCVGCHLDNDGPELMFGGTVYSYVEGDFRRAGLTPPTGKDCFGLEGVEVHVTGGDGQEFVVTSNEAGNFFVEGKPTDLVKPFGVEIRYTPEGTTSEAIPPMFTHPSYGGCGRCHVLDAQTYPGPGESMDDVSKDQVVIPAGTKIGVPGGLNLPPAPPK
jgi:hypothetical protein